MEAHFRKLRPFKQYCNFVFPSPAQPAKPSIDQPVLWDDAKSL
jgi:hypothetical protein